MGAGFHGGFGNTEGAKKKNSIPVNSLGDVRYSKKKTEGYLQILIIPSVLQKQNL